MKYYSATKRNEIGSFVEVRMDLESIIQSKISQKERNRYTLMHAYGIQKIGTDEPISRAGIEMQRMGMWTQACGEGEGGTNWEIRIDIYIPPCVKQVASWKLLQNIGSSARCSVMIQRGGRRGGVVVGGRSKRKEICEYIQLVYFIIQQKLAQHWRAIIFQQGYIKKIKQAGSFGSRRAYGGPEGLCPSCSFLTKVFPVPW